MMDYETWKKETSDLTKMPKDWISKCKNCGEDFYNKYKLGPFCRKCTDRALEGLKLTHKINNDGLKDT